MSNVPPPIYPNYATPGYANPDPLAADNSYLKTISIFHYVWGGLTLLGSCFAIIYIVLGVLMLNGTFNLSGPPPRPPTVVRTTNANGNVTFTATATSTAWPNAGTPAAPAGLNTNAGPTGAGANPPPTGFQNGPPPPPFGPQPPREVGYLLIGVGAVVLVLGWTLGLLSIFSGRRIAARRSRVFSLVVAGINCISFPFGTALGVFTIILLSKETVKGMYSQA